MSIGLCMGEFCPLHQGHLDLIMRAKKENDRCVVVLLNYGNPDARLPFARRAQLIREFFMNDRQVQVVAVPNVILGSAHSPSVDQWRAVFAEIRHLSDSPSAPFAVYVANPGYVEPLRQLGESVILVSKEQPLKSADIRCNPLRYWPHIASTFHPYLTRNILVVGTASEGKTTLVNDIAKYYNLPTAVEWGRVYMEQHGLRDPELTVDDFVEFIVGQLRLCQKAIREATNDIMLSDTDNLITLMYAKAYAEDDQMPLSMADYNEVLYPLALSLKDQIHWDRIFVMEPGGAYVDDGFRYMGQSSMDERMSNHRKLLSLMNEFGFADRLEFLKGGAYLDNFLTVKKYIHGLLSE